MKHISACINCGSRSITYSTEEKGDYWIWKKLCASCNNERENQILDL